MITNLKIRTSQQMNVENLNCNLLRVPRKIRIENGLQLDDFVCLRNRLGGVTVFRIAEAFKADICYDENCAYVANKIHEKLFLSNRENNDIEIVNNITLGCDPEAFIVDITNGNILAANRYLKKHGEVGNDGLLLEFRPNPSTEASTVCKTLWGLINKARQILNTFPESHNLMIMAGSSYKGLTAGFHLHYGFPHPLLKRGQVARLITSVFDFYVGIPSIIPEGNIENHRRTVQFVAYGKPGGFRVSSRSFEFRLPGGINLKNPTLTTGLLALGNVVAEDLVSRINTCTEKFLNMEEIKKENSLRCLYPNLPALETYYNIICNPDIQLALDYTEKIKEDVRKMVGYQKRKIEVEAYFDYLKKPYKSDNNIEVNWREFYHENK